MIRFGKKVFDFLQSIVYLFWSQQWHVQILPSVQNPPVTF